MTDARETTFVVYLEDPERPVSMTDGPDGVQLSESLFLVRSSESQSRVYHDIKHRTRPKSLFVGRLEDDPKFKGMAEGALKWVRKG